MAASVTELRPRAQGTRHPNTRSGLWEALVAQIEPRSAAGSRLVGPDGPGQPISAPAGNVVAMFSRRPGDRGPDPGSAA